MKKIVEISNLSVKYQTPLDEISAVSNISFDIYENEFVSIVGPSRLWKKHFALLHSRTYFAHFRKCFNKRRAAENRRFHRLYASKRYAFWLEKRV